MSKKTPIIRITARDLDSGEEGVQHLAAGQFVVVCAEPMHVLHEQRYDDGTVLITLKPRAGKCPSCDAVTRDDMKAGRNVVDRGDGPEWCDDEWHNEADA